MTDPIPSKERCNCPNGSYGIKHTTLCYEAQLVTARRTAEHWKAEHLAGNAEIERQQAQIATLKGYIERTALAGYRCAECAARLTAEAAPALRPDGMPEPSLEVLKRVTARIRVNAADTAYLAEWAVEQIEEHDQSFDLRWKADMRAIKRWQEAHPGNDLTWPDHADLCVWLLEQLDARAAQPPGAGQR